MSIMFDDNNEAACRPVEERQCGGVSLCKLRLVLEIKQTCTGKKTKTGVRDTVVANMSEHLALQRRPRQYSTYNTIFLQRKENLQCK